MTDPQAIAAGLTDAQKLKVARAIASALGDNFADAFPNKQRWIAKRGMRGGRFRDVNEPFQSDYLDAAEAAVRWTEETLSTGYVRKGRSSAAQKLSKAPVIILKTGLASPSLACNSGAEQWIRSK